MQQFGVEFPQIQKINFPSSHNLRLTSHDFHTMASAFYRLPNEVLALFVEYIIASNDESLEDSSRGETFCVKSLRIMRRVHPRFAQLDTLNERLFTSIQLIVDGDFLDRFENAHYNTIRKYVTRITFKLSDYTRDLELDEFKDLVETNCPPDLTFNDDEIDDGWVEWGGYSSSTLADQATCAFTPFLQSVRKDLQIEIGPWKRQLPPPITPFEIASQARLKEICQRLSPQRLGDYVFDIVVRSLADAKVQPVSLCLNNETTSPCRMLWMKDGTPPWNRLDLSKLTYLRYEPRMFASYSYDDPQLEDPQRQSGMGLDLVLQKCSKSIERLVLSDQYTPIRWVSTSDERDY